MQALWEFLSPEAGQKRRAWLDETIGGAVEYATPPEMRQLLGLASEVNPVVSMERAGTAAKTVANPNATGWERVGAVGDVASNMAGVLAPIAGAGKAGTTGVQAVTDALTGVSMAPRAAVGNFVADQSGKLSLGAGDAVTERGAAVMDMLKTGRAADVTDEMLDLGDSTLNARLNEYLYQNYDLPMDTASRMDRAKGIGMDTETPLYHGTANDFPSFDANRIGARETGWYGDGVYSTAMPDLANEYTKSARFDVGGESNVMPVHVRRGQEYVWGSNPIATSRAESKAFKSNLSKNGYDGVRVPNDYGDDLLTPQEAANYEVVTFDPKNIRSKFARFDPRLAHLKNLSAGAAGAVTLGSLLNGEDEAARMEQMRAYLGL